MPPIAPIDFDDLAPVLRESLRGRYERLGYLGDFFRHMAHQPAALIAFDAFTEACKHALPLELAETIALTVATKLGNDYERNQHERLAVRNGASRAWVSNVERLDPDAHGTGLGDAGSGGDELDDVARAVQRFVLSSIDALASCAGGSGDPDRTDRAGGTVGDDRSAQRLDEVVACTDDATAAAVALLTARFVAHAVISRACRLSAPVRSIFEAGSVD
ncbi:MAG: hypothetical protein ABIW84_08005 [Ilumatobacteraceae bacterium]